VAAHSEIDAQEIPQTLVVPSTSVRVHANAPPVGSVEVKIPPAPSLATQREVDGQEILLIHVPGSMVALAHAAAPPVGSVELSMLPAESPAKWSRP
jgi:hypothetical protein